MMSTTHHEHGMHDPGMETLSALFDGELQGDAARFAMKRLGHDVQWRQALGNWQLVGDALRGQASIAAPRDFAARVAAVVAVEPTLVDASSVSASAISGVAVGSGRRRWIGGAALAASVAMVAMFFARPFSQDATTTPGAGTAAPIEFAVAPATSQTNLPVAATPSTPDAGNEVGAAAIAVADVPRRTSARRSRGQSQRAALRVRLPTAPANARAAQGTAIAVVDLQPAAPANPFRPQHPEVVARPWPRAVLPSASAAGAFTASYGSGPVSSPSFYPFEPRLPNTTDATSAPQDDQQP